MSRVVGSAILAVAWLLLLIGAAAAESETNTDRPGGDLGPPIELEFKQGSFLTFEAECEGLCKQNAQCKAWTMVKPGVQGTKARCWLKGSVPRAVANKCCSSGVKAAASGGGTSSGGTSFYQILNDLFPNPGTVDSCNAAFAKCQAIAVAQLGPTTGITVGAAECLPRQQRCMQTAAAAQGGGGTTGGGGGVPAEWAETLSTHNAKRAIHRSPALSWSASLAAQAQAWANKCSFSHDNFNGFGENLYWGTNRTGKDAVEWWYAEKRFYDWDDPIGSYNQGDNDKSRETRHFTQVVWKATTTLGCGMAACSGKSYFVCRYKPPGNFNAQNAGVLDANVQPIQGIAATKQKQQPAEEQGQAGDGPTIATVIQSVDVYDAPGGDGTQTGVLKKGAKVKLIGCNDGWCEVKGKKVPGGSGYVYNADDFRSLDN
jgi:hypothetical protein